MMEVEFSLNQADMDAFARFHQPQGQKPRQGTKEGKRPPVTFFYLGFLILLVAVFLLAPAKGALDKIVDLAFPFVGGLIFGVLGVCLVALWLGKLNTRSTRQYCEEEHNRWMFESRRVRIHPEGITIWSAHQEQTTRWPVIWQIVATSEYVFLYSGAQTAHAVPRRAFRDQQHFEEFVALARQYQAGPKSTGIIAGLPPESAAIPCSDAS